MYLQNKAMDSLKSCPFCNQPFLSYVLKKHIGIVHLGLESINHVEENNVKPTQKVEENVEKVKYTGNKRSGFTCDCGKFYPTKRNVERHIRIQHEGKVFKCEQCGKTYTEYSRLNKHIKSDQCAKTFTKSKHQSLNSTSKSKNLSCEPCGKTYTSKNNLTRHIEEQHENKTYPCDQCGKLFKQSRILRQHYNVEHLGVRYNCDICGKEFNEERNLKRHFKGKHEG